MAGETNYLLALDEDLHSKIKSRCALKKKSIKAYITALILRDLK